MLKNAAWLAVIVYALSFLVFLVMLAPAALVVYLMPGAWAAGGFVFALLFAWSVKEALLEPFAIACLMQVFFKTIENQQPDPEWEARLEQLSGKFRQLKARALGETTQPASDISDVQTT
jgi:membrane protein implicated in regulation of membrane protease activity